MAPTAGVEFLEYGKSGFTQYLTLIDFDAIVSLERVFLSWCPAQIHWNNSAENKV
jgi:hypothetical protein